MDILSYKIKKYSVTIAGHTTSFSLEEPFFKALKHIAAQQNSSLAALIAQIDVKRGTNLSSALRLYVLDYLQQSLSDKSI